MTRMLLDTTFLIDVLNDRRGRADLMERLILEQHTLTCCAINVAEVYVGLRATETRKTEALLRQLTYVPIGNATRHGPRPPKLPKLRGPASGPRGADL